MIKEYYIGHKNITLEKINMVKFLRVSKRATFCFDADQLDLLKSTARENGLRPSSVIRGCLEMLNNNKAKQQILNKSRLEEFKASISQAKRHKARALNAGL